MKRRMVYLLLVVSLVFNVLFVFGYIRMKRVKASLATPEGRAEFLADRLKMTPSQKKAVMRIQRERLTEMKKIQDVHAQDLDILWRELEKNNTNRGVVEQLSEVLGETCAMRTEMEVQRLVEFVSVMDSDQRKQFLKIIRARNRM